MGTNTKLSRGRTPHQNITPRGPFSRGVHQCVVMSTMSAEELAKQTENAELAAQFGPIYDKLAANIDKIIEEINETEGKPQDIGGYYLPDEAKTAAAMRPSATFNEILGA